MLRQIHEKVKRFINQNNLITQGDELILGVSGGADSMMLLHYFYTYQNEYGISLKVAHVHHGIRESADLDAELVQQVCSDKKLPFFVHHCNIKLLASERKMSEEEVGREERYNFFISFLNQNAKIVTAHTMNDQAETMMMRFIRGTDIKGLGGIPPRRDQIIRPLLCLSRYEIEKYCEFNKVPYRHDETNFMPIYTRNKMRLKCIPYIEDNMNPSLVKVLGEHSVLYREEEAFLQEHTKALYLAAVEAKAEKLIINQKVFEKYHSYMQKRIILLAIENLVGKAKDITSKHLQSCKELLSAQSGKQIHLPYGLIFSKEYSELILAAGLKEDHTPTVFCETLELGENWINGADLTIKLSLVDKERINQKSENIYTKYIDYGRIKNGLQIRTRRPADFIRLPQGTKKLKKFFIDEKIPKGIRESLPLIADGDEIIWIIGSRLNVDYYISEQTKQILEIQMTQRY